MKKEDIIKLMESGKTDEEIINLLKVEGKKKVKAYLVDQSDDDIRRAAAECADILRELNVMNNLAKTDEELFDAAEKIYAWLYDSAWMVPKEGWTRDEEREEFDKGLEKPFQPEPEGGPMPEEE